MSGLRPLVWRILLNYLPLETAEWEDTLRRNKEIYQMYKEELIVQPKIKHAEQ